MGQSSQSIYLFLADEGNKIRVIAGILKSDSDFNLQFSESFMDLKES